MSTPADRLRSARKRKYATATDAAAALGLSKHTYIQHENGTRDFDIEQAEFYARRLNTTPEWLLFERGAAVAEQPMAKIIGRVGADPEGRVILVTRHETGDLAPIPPGGSDDTSAVDVVGHSMSGFADDGSLIYFEEQRNPPFADMLGHVVVCELDTGEVLVKRLLRGSKRGLYDLESIRGPTRHDAKIRWAAHVTAVIPPWKAKRIARRSGAAA